MLLPFSFGPILFGSVKWLHAAPGSAAGSRPAALDPACTSSCLALGWLVLRTGGVGSEWRSSWSYFWVLFIHWAESIRASLVSVFGAVFYYSVDGLRKSWCTSRLSEVLDWEFRSFYLSLKYKPAEWETQKEDCSLPYLRYITLYISALFENCCALPSFVATNWYQVLCTQFFLII